MADCIRIGIVGYGNIGRGVERAFAQNPDMRLCGVFTRRDPASVQTETGARVFSMDELPGMRDQLDVLILCGGSATDLPVQGPALARMFCTIDSFDTHAKIPDYYAAMDEAARAGGHIAILSVGWDPGLFSIMRAYGEAVLPVGETYTFWGKGVSQGHSDAIRRVAGVKNAIQYTIPIDEAVAAARSGTNPKLSTREKHLRECFVVLKEGADADAVARRIKEMPNYFADYDTIVHFIDEETLARDHGGMPHGGFAIRSGETGGGTRQLIDYTLKLGSNPEFTANILLAYARAAYRLRQAGQTGAMSVLDIAPGLLSIKSPAQLRAELL